MRARAVVPPTPARCRERGTSLLEATLVAALLLVVAGSLLGVFDSFTRAEHGMERRLDADSSLRLAMAEVTRDVRAADPLLPAPVSSEMATSVELVLPPEGDGEPSSLRFRLDEDTDTLVREVLDRSGGTPQSTRLLLDDVARPDGAPVFRYFDEAGSELTPGTDAADRIAGCAARIEVSLDQRVGTSGATRHRSGSVALRNRVPGEGPC